MSDRYAAYASLQLERPAEGVLRVVMSAPGRLNAAGHEMHRDLAGIWTEIDRDPEVRAARNAEPRLLTDASAEPQSPLTFTLLELRVESEETP